MSLKTIQREIEREGERGKASQLFIELVEHILVLFIIFN